MKEKTRIVIKKYRIHGGLFTCEAEIKKNLGKVLEVKWEELRTGLECRASVTYEWKASKMGNNHIHVTSNMMEEEFAIRTWRLVFVMENKNEYTAYYVENQEKRDFGKMLSLENMEVLPTKHIHLIPAIDKDGAFAIRKWRTKSAAIKTQPAYAKSVSREKTMMHIVLDKQYDKEVREAEIWLWSRALKRVYRIPMESSKVNNGFINFDLKQFVAINGDSLQRLWEIYLVLNLDGGYYLSRIEEMKNRELKRKQRKAEESGEEFDMEHKPKEMDESYRFFGGIPYGETENERYDTKVGSSEPTKNLLMPYYTQDMQLACKFILRKNFYVNQFREQITRLRIRKGICRIHILCTHKEFQYHDFVLRFRDGACEDKKFKQVLSRETRKGIHQIWEMDLNKVDFRQYTWDLFLIGEKENVDYEIRPINTKSKKFLKAIYKGYGNSYFDNKGQIIFPYITLNENVVLFCRAEQEYDKMRYVWKERLAIFLYNRRKKFYNKKGIILLYEKFCTMAQDNSFYMFHYIMNSKDTEHLKSNTYYIIKENQPDCKKLQKFHKQVIPFMSIRHLIYLQAARVFVSIDSKRHAYIWRSRNSKVADILQEKPFVFLQHGVLGLKRVDYIYKKGGINSANQIVVSSEAEKKLVEKWFGYEDNDIIIAGMTRWEVMKDKSFESREVLLMPTWRNWLQEVSEDIFLKSDYYLYYSELLESPKLQELLEKYDLKLIFCMHPKFSQFMPHYQVKSKRICLFSYDKEPINQLLMRCRLFITDYSSASWDVYYMKKPVIFYQFDYTKYMEEQGSYYDMEKELFGARVTNVAELLEAIEKNCIYDFKEDEKYSAMRTMCLPNDSVQVCNKIFNEINKRYLITSKQ